MNWKPYAKRFGLRFGVALLVLGGLYGLTFGYRLPGSKRPASPSQKVMALAAALDQTYLDAQSIYGFSENYSVAYDDLSAVQGRMTTDTQDLRTKLAAAQGHVSQQTAERIDAVADQYDKAAASYKTVDHSFSSLLGYDPSDDLNLATNDPMLASRATAASTGLQKARSTGSLASNTSGSLGVGTASQSNVVSDTTAKQLQTEADCFASLASQVSAHATTVSATRERCTKAYPALRRQVISNMRDASYSKDLLDTLHTQVPPLLQNLRTQATR